ncbi:MAG: thioredoxin family protein [Ignavibacterium sp.]|nr:MAG: thioredoxin family protein [Ignavibacterium sp.]MDD5608219.1 thioredoxin family protein [Ignavibacterium sp.]
MPDNKLKIDSLLPQFNLPGTDGNSYSSEGFKNKNIMIVIFSCNHCPYVQAYEERMINLQKEFKDRGVQIVAINSNYDSKYPEDSFDEMKKRAVERKFNFPYLRDETQKIAKAFGASHTPQIFLFNKERKLKYEGKIDDNWQEPDRVQNHYLRDAITEVLDEREVSIPETFSIGCTIKWKEML